MLTGYQLSLWFVCTFHKFMFWFVFPCVFCSVWSSLEFNSLLWTFTSQMVIQDPYDPPFPHSVSHSSLSASKWSDLWFRLNRQITRWEKPTTSSSSHLTWAWFSLSTCLFPDGCSRWENRARFGEAWRSTWVNSSSERTRWSQTHISGLNGASGFVLFSLEMDWPLFQSAVAVPWAEF